MHRWCLMLISLAVLANQQQPVDGAAIPIWELLSHEEKMGRLFYVFVHLVKQYCKTSEIPDCQKVLTLYGVSNLVSEDEHSLDIMDPYQRDAKIIVWEKIMRGEFKLPAKAAKKPTLQAHQHQPAIFNEVHSTPYEVRVRPPANFVPPPPPPPTPAAADADADADAYEQFNETDASSSSTVVLRLGRSVSSIPDHEAQLLQRLAQQ